jgi:hypothetical protein
MFSREKHVKYALSFTQSLYLPNLCWSSLSSNLWHSSVHLTAYLRLCVQASPQRTIQLVKDWSCKVRRTCKQDTRDGYMQPCFRLTLPHAADISNFALNTKANVMTTAGPRHVDTPGRLIIRRPLNRYSLNCFGLGAANLLQGAYTNCG